MDWTALREKALKETQGAVALSVGDDQMVIQAVSTLEEFDRVINLLAKRLSEWYAWFDPKTVHDLQDNHTLVKAVLHRFPTTTPAMGKLATDEQQKALQSFAQSAEELINERENLEAYLKEVMVRHAPNLTIIAGVTIGARLLRDAGSLKKLASVPSSTIQLYGAEKALFRHLRTGARPPKYGHLFNHPFVAKATNKGKAARVLSDKLSLACRIDYFKGEPIGKKIREELEGRIL